MCLFSQPRKRQLGFKFVIHTASNAFPKECQQFPVLDPNWSWIIGGFDVFWGHNTDLCIQFQSFFHNIQKVIAKRRQYSSIWGWNYSMPPVYQFSVCKKAIYINLFRVHFNDFFWWDFATNSARCRFMQGLVEIKGTAGSCRAWLRLKGLTH